MVADAARRDLAPAARRRTEIDHARPGLEQFVALVDFSELKGRTRTQALAFGALDIWIADLSRQPSARRGGSAFLIL